MKGKLYGVGVGPGDPELITLKALRVIEKTGIIAAPDSGSERNAALEIAAKAVDFSEKELLKLYMPMTTDSRALNVSHDAAAQTLINKLNAGNDVAFLTLGDPTIYSTYMYIHDRVADAGYETHIAEGIPSFCAAAARLNIPLCEGRQALHIIPAAYDSEDYMRMSGTKVLMKPGKAFPRIREQLESGALHGKAMMVERCGMDGERVYHDLAEIEEEMSYFSIIIIKE